MRQKFDQTPRMDDYRSAGCVTAGQTPDSVRVVRWSIVRDQTQPNPS